MRSGPVDPGGVARLYGVDRKQRDQVLLRVEASRLALVRGNGEVLEGNRRAAERVRGLGSAREVEERARRGFRSKDVAEGRNMRALVGADDPGLISQGTGQHLVANHLGVERRLEVLERQRELDDRHVLLLTRTSSGCGRRGCRQHRTGADYAAPQERCPCGAVKLCECSSQRVVRVERFESGW
jgi:hypothetical protein